MIKENEIIETEEVKKEKTPEIHHKNKKLKVDKKHIHGFIAGLLAALILFTGIMAGVNPEFFKGTFTRQMGNTALNEEIDLIDATCEPASLKAATSFDQKIVINLKEDELKNIKKSDIDLQGLFKGLEVSSIGFENDKFTVAIKGNTTINHASDDVRENPSGDIYILDTANTKVKTAYVAKVAIEYPKLSALDETILEKASYEDNLQLTLSGDEFAKTPTAEEIGLSGGFADMSVSNIILDGQKLSFNINGEKAKDSGNGVVTLQQSALKSGFSVDKIIGISGAPFLYADAPLTVQTSVNRTIKLRVENDSFSDIVTPEMFTFGGELKDAKVSKIEATNRENTIEVTLTAPELRKVGVGTIAVSKDALKSQRSASGKIEIANPSITVLQDKEDVAAKPDIHVLNVFSAGDDFLPHINAEDIVLKDAFAGLKIGKVEWLSGYRITVTVEGKAKVGSGKISIRSAALGGITGAEAVINEVSDLGLLEIDPVKIEAKRTAALEAQNEQVMDGSTGMWGLDKILDWGIDQVKNLAIQGIKAGAEAGAKSGLMYLLRQTGLIGPSVESMLEDIQNSITELKNDQAIMEARVLNEVKSQGFQNRLAILISTQQAIDTQYKIYSGTDSVVGLSTRIADFRSAHPAPDPLTNPNIKKMIDNYKAAHPTLVPTQDPVIKKAIEDFLKPYDPMQQDNYIKTMANGLMGRGGTVETQNIGGKTKELAAAMKGSSSTAIPLITAYRDLLHDNQPFEHNMIEKLRYFVAETNMIIAQGTLLYSEYCNYNTPSDQSLTDVTLKIFAQDINNYLEAQEALLPDLSGINIQNKPNVGDITVKLNKNEKKYILIAGTPNMETLVNPIRQYSVYKAYDASQYLDNVYGARWPQWAWEGARSYKPFEINTLYRQLEKDDMENDLFSDYKAYYIGSMTRKQYLGTYTGGDYPDWLFLGPMAAWVPFWEDASRYHRIMDTENRSNDGVYYEKHGYDLFTNYKYLTAKFFVVERTNS